MYAKLTEGNLEVFSGGVLRYTTWEDGIMYYVQVINPGETDFNEAGYYKVVGEDGTDADKINAYYTYSLVDNNIVGKVKNLNEEALVQ